MITKPDKNKCVKLVTHVFVVKSLVLLVYSERFRSNKNIYAQLIDDVAGVTLASASTLNTNVSRLKTEEASAAGKLIAERGLEKNIKEVFDRGGYLYHGRVNMTAHENGLVF